MTILEIKTAIASLLDLENGVADLTQNGQDLALVALNQVRRQAELAHDFEFQRKLVTLTVNGVTGGSLESAVLYGTATLCAVKTVIDVGWFDNGGNFRAVEWTTISESLERQRGVLRFNRPAWVSDDQEESVFDLGRFTVTGGSIYRYPKNTEINYTVGLEVYVFSADWALTTQTVAITGGTGVTGVNTTYYPYGFYTAETGGVPRTLWLSKHPILNASAATTYAIWHNTVATGFVVSLASDIGNSGVANWHKFANGVVLSGADTGSAGTFTGTANATYAANGTDTTSDIWTTYAAEYLIWGAVVYLNHTFKKFVFRQEGNLQPPEKMRDTALEAFKDWDSGLFEQNRRHRR